MVKIKMEFKNKSKYEISYNKKISNNSFAGPSSQIIVERQMKSYMNIFKNIADQISDLNNRIDYLNDAAE